MVIYALGGKVWVIDLRAGASHAPRQISSASNICGIVPVGERLQLTPDGLDSWVEVSDCSTSPASLYVRTTMNSTDSVVPLTNARLIDKLDDGAMNTLGFLVRDSNGLSFYSRDLVRLGAVAGGSGLQSLPSNAGRDYMAVQATWYRFNNSLRRITWSATGATLDPSIYTFTTSVNLNNGATPGWVGDIDAMYFIDGNTLMKIPSGGAPTPLATFAGTPIGTLFLTGNHVVVQQADRSPSQVLVISTIPKTGGVATTIATGNGAVVMGTTADSVLYSQGATLHVAKADGSADQVIPPDNAGSVVLQRTQVAERWYVDSLAKCVSDTATDKSCSNGTFVQRDLATQVPTNIGRVTHAKTYPSTPLHGLANYGNIPDMTGIPAPIEVHTSQDAAGHLVNTSDLYIWTPGSANSLGRVTYNIP